MNGQQRECLMGLLQPSSKVKGVGIDILPISRVAQWIERYDRHTLTLIFTPDEIDRCQSLPPDDSACAFAVCFAAKEAVGKALGTGLVGINWDEIASIVTSNYLKVELFGNADLQARHNGIQKWITVWCKWDEHVLVHVLALCKN
jgi:holo-[acyl-carrier protein] synthase